MPPIWPADVSWNAFQQQLKWWKLGTGVPAERQAALVILNSVYPFHSELAVQLEEVDEAYYVAPVDPQFTHTSPDLQEAVRKFQPVERLANMITHLYRARDPTGIEMRYRHVTTFARKSGESYRQAVERLRGLVASAIRDGTKFTEKELCASVLAGFHFSQSDAKTVRTHFDFSKVGTGANTFANLLNTVETVLAPSGLFTYDADGDAEMTANYAKGGKGKGKGKKQNGWNQNGKNQPGKNHNGWNQSGNWQKGWNQSGNGWNDWNDWQENGNGWNGWQNGKGWKDHGQKGGKGWNDWTQSHGDFQRAFLADGTEFYVALASSTGAPEASNPKASETENR